MASPASRRLQTARQGWSQHPAEYAGKRHPLAVDLGGRLEVAPSDRLEHAPDVDVERAGGLAPGSVVLDAQLFQRWISLGSIGSRLTASGPTGSNEHYLAARAASTFSGRAGRWVILTPQA